MKGAFKELNRSDVFLTSYEARKHWTVSYTNFSSYGIEKEIVSGSKLNSLKVSYYTGFDSNRGIPSGSSELDLQSSITIPGARNIGSRVLMYNIPRQCFGTHLTMKSVSISGSFGKIEDNEGVLLWGGNIVGDIIYTKGLLLISDNSLISSLNSSTTEVLNWESNLPIHTCNVLCKVRDYEFNYTYNASRKEAQLNDEEQPPYITSIGLYNEAGELLSVAKLSKPIKKTWGVDMTFCVRLDI